MHKTLERQLVRFYGSMKDVPKDQLDFLELVDKTYTENEKEHASIEKALDESREDLVKVNKLLESKSNNIGTEVHANMEEIIRAKIHTEIIIENLTSGLIEYSSDFVILRINRAAENMLGVKKEDVIGLKIETRDVEDAKLKSLAGVLYPGASSEVSLSNDSVLGVDGNFVSVDEFTIHYPVERELNITTAPIVASEGSSSNGFIKVLRDVTREKLISRSKSEFISIAAHQLRTPLSAIKWAMWVIMEGDLGPLLPEQIKLLKRGYETNEKMITLVNDLLNVARIEDGRFGYEFKKGSLAKLVSGVVSSMEMLAVNKNVTIKFDESSEKIKPFAFDSKKVTLATQNIIDNAVKYTPEGGLVSIKLFNKGHYANVCVEDSGVGVPEDQKGRLFSKFFRARNVLRMETAGSGLGLFIAKNIISRHGGEIEVKSKEGKGSAFCFSLPTDESLIPKDETISEEAIHSQNTHKNKKNKKNN